MNAWIINQYEGRWKSTLTLAMHVVNAQYIVISCADSALSDNTPPPPSGDPTCLGRVHHHLPDDLDHHLEVGRLHAPERSEGCLFLFHRPCYHDSLWK